MSAVNLHHRTTYRYHKPVTLGPHRLMLRPRESRNLRLLAHRVIVTPPADIKWNTDMHGNAVGIAVFDDDATCLQIDSYFEVQLLTRERPELER